MPTPRKSLDDLKETGTYRKNVGRYKGLVTAVEGFRPLTGPPPQLDEHEAHAWRDLQARATPGTLAESDFVLMVLASRLTAKALWKYGEFTIKDGNLLQSLMRDLGMAPLTRGRITPAKQKEAESKLSALVKQMSGARRPN